MIDIKSELCEYRFLIKELELIDDRIKTVKSHLEYISPALTAVPKSKMHIDFYDSLFEFQEKQKDKRQEMAERIQYVSNFLDGIPNSKVRVIFKYRYEKGYEWERIGVEINYNGNYARNIHDNYLKKVNYTKT